MMKLKKRTHKNVAIILAMLMLLASSISTIEVKADPMDDCALIGQYIDSNFYGRSEPEDIDLCLSADTVSFYAYCKGNTTDTITCVIVDNDHDGLYNRTYTFAATGNVITFDDPFPAGEYTIYFVGGHANVLKTEASVIFAKYLLW